MAPPASHHAPMHHAQGAHHAPPASTGTPGQAEPLAVTASDLAATVAMPPQVALVQPGRVLGPYGTTLFDQAGRPIAPYTGQPPGSQELPRVYDESSTGPPSHEVKTQVYRPRGASAMPFPPELPSQLPPQATTPQPSGARTSVLIAVFLVLLAGLAAAAYMNMDYLLERLG
jgi:serine/threonine-protein kinase